MFTCSPDWHEGKAVPATYLHSLRTAQYAGTSETYKALPFHTHTTQFTTCGRHSHRAVTLLFKRAKELATASGRHFAVITQEITQ